MGVKTLLTQKEAQALFPSFSLTNIKPTTHGVIDTTYISEKYILKKYERNIDKRIEEDTKRLKSLFQHQLNVPRVLAKNQEWYLYERLCGSSPKSIAYYHIQSLARFMAKLHRLSQTQYTSPPFLAQYDIQGYLYSVKKDFFLYYKMLEPLKSLKLPCDGFIHGDIFPDNTLFNKETIAVFDFIDGGCGTFSFDIAVAIMAFNPHQKPSLTKLFLQTYNQNSPKKIKNQELQKQLKMAKKLYMLLRASTEKKTQKAKMLLKPYIK